MNTKLDEPATTLPILILLAIVLTMIIAASYGFYSGNFGAVKDVWTVVGSLAGIVVGYYFKRS